jgi:acyl-CoA dehydrogenase
MARKVAREEIAPKAAEYDRTMEFPWDIVKKIWNLGILNPFVPESCGGLIDGWISRLLMSVQIINECRF